MLRTNPAKLLAVLANPSTGSGERTMARVALASAALGFDGYLIANLFSLPSRDVTGIAELGKAEDGWSEARAALLAGLNDCGGVLLAYGVAEPHGPARGHHRAQVSWFSAQLEEYGLPVVCVGDGPRHPSRWQRWTNKAHPDLPFAEALAISLVSLGKGAEGPAARLHARRARAASAEPAP